MKAQIKKSMSKNTTSNNKDKKSKDKTSNKEEEEQEKEKNNIPQTQNIKNIERYIYITNFTDYNSIITINHLFEDINSLAFNLSSKIDIISKILTEEEQNSNEIDYISGFQIVDSKLRIAIIEGITGKGIQKVKNAFPKKQMNNENFKIFSNSEILFDKRIYSKFNLVLNCIKLRKDLNDILTSFEIYMNANKYRNVYDTFMNLGVILRADTLDDIANSNSFPDVDKLIELERKFGGIINPEDLTGIKKVKKYDIKKLLINLNDDINIKNNDKSYENLLNQTQNKKKILVKSMKLMPINIKKKVKFKLEGENTNKKEENKNENSFDLLEKHHNYYNKRYLTLDINDKENLNIKKSDNSKSIKIDIDNLISYNSPIRKHNKLDKLENNNRYNSIDNDSNKLNKYKIKLRKTPKDNYKNIRFIKILKERENKLNNPIEIFNRNKKYLNKIIRKKFSERFCQPFKGEYDHKKEILFSPAKINHYVELVNEMRKKYLKDKDHYYSYSEKYLTLSFPMVEGFRNEEYIKYIENKSKWIVDKDFDRYKQPQREKIFFPRIQKEI